MHEARVESANRWEEEHQRGTDEYDRWICESSPVTGPEEAIDGISKPSGEDVKEIVGPVLELLNSGCF
jgi:hypothetical protein